MKFIGIIPARYDSKRFPGKVLADIRGKSMIRRVYEQVKKSNFLTDVIVGTDDERIRKHVESFGGKVMMTASHHRNGTERCNEVVSLLNTDLDTEDVVINIQGDEPFLNPQLLDQLAGSFTNQEIDIVTPIKRIINEIDLFDPGVVKVVINEANQAIYFSRSVIPFVRNFEKEEWITHHIFYKHIGIYAFKKEILSRLAALERSPLEKAESLEQLRWLENGYKVYTEITEFESIGIDSPEDLSKLSNGS